VKRADSLLIPYIRDLGIGDGVRLAEIKRDWYVLFNKPLSYHMSPSLLSEGEILLNVDSPVWLQELNFHKEVIQQKLSSYGVRTVRFRLGRVSTEISSGIGSQKSRVRSKKSEDKQVKAEEHAFIEKTASHINDEALRLTVRLAMEKAIASGKTKIR